MRRWLDRVRGRARQPLRPLPDALWQTTLARCPYLTELTPPQQSRLRGLTALFLEDKEFHGAQGLLITDEMAVTIAAQACLPVLHFGPGAQALRWYDDFVGIVVHADEVVAQREFVDETGVVHAWEETLAGEAMPDGPVMLSWRDVDAASSESGYNVVIHEFVHKLDLRDGQADGCPPLPAGFMGQNTLRGAHDHWLSVMQSAYQDFREAVIRAERFGAAPTWLDPYGAENIAEFYAVASEAYFVNRSRFGVDFPALLGLFDAYYRNWA
ncbi:MAG: zinc-dependent peptidase [Curvibacter sp.]|jgi:Mlc titration factor MtfA (ptsG expression regulator)